MPQFTCLACKTRLHRAAGADHRVCDLLDTRRWVEDDGHFRVERVAVARPEASSSLEMRP